MRIPGFNRVGFIFLGLRKVQGQCQQSETIERLKENVRDIFARISVEMC